MKNFPFKRQLIILACIIAALCVAIPVATFAQGTPPGEQKRVQTAVRAQAVAGQPTTITADCSSPQPLVTLNKGDIFNANATLISTDSNEESEGETLQILDASTTPPTVLLNLDVNTGNATIQPFTASVANDPIQACIVGIDTDETGTVTFTVTPVPTLVPTPPFKLPKVPHSISRSQLLRLVGIVLSVGGPGLVSTHCDQLITAKEDEIGGLIFECLSDINDIIGLVNEGKLFLPFSQFFLLHFQVLQIECQAGVQDACQKLFGTIPA